jgi:hypothetical protein
MSPTSVSIQAPSPEKQITKHSRRESTFFSFSFSANVYHGTSNPRERYYYSLEFMDQDSEKHKNTRETKSKCTKHQTRTMVKMFLVSSEHQQHQQQSAIK